MAINQISTDLLNLAFLSNDEDEDEPPLFAPTNDKLKEDDKQPMEMGIEAVATDKQRKNISTIQDDDLAQEARCGILEKYKMKSSPHLLVDSYPPLASSSLRKKENSRQQVADKQMYSSEAPVKMSKSKKKSWFGKRKNKSKTKNKGIKKLSDDTKLKIQNMGKLNGKRSKATGKAEHAEIPTVIKLKKITRPASGIPNPKERSYRDDKNASFADSISTMSLYIHEDGKTSTEQGVSGRLSNMLSAGEDDGPAVKDAKGQTWKVYVDDDTGIRYYHNPVTRSTTWTNPVDDIEKVEAINNQNDSESADLQEPADTDTGTNFSDSDVKRSKGSTVTGDDTLLSITTSRDGNWIEQGVTRMLDTTFKIGLEDTEVDDDTLVGSLVSEQATKDSKVSQAEIDNSKVARKPRSLPPSFPSIDSENPPTVPQRKDPLVGTGTEAEDDKKNSSDVQSAAGATWFGNLVAMLSHDEEDEDDTKTAVKEPAPQNSESWHSLQLVSSIDGPESAMSAASTRHERDASKSNPASQLTLNDARPTSFSDPSSPNRDSRKLENGNTEKLPANGTSFLYSLYNTVMSEDEAEDDKEAPPPSTHLLRGREDRTLTGLTGITGASVFSGISDDGPLREQLAAKGSVLIDSQYNEESFDTETSLAKPNEDKMVTTSSRNPNEVFGEINVAANKKSRSPWRPIIDPQTGRTYYFHRITRRRSWTKPDDFDDSKKPAFHWGIGHKDSTNVGPPSPAKGSTTRDGAQNPVLGSSEMDVSILASSLDVSSDEDLEIVGIAPIIDIRSYDPTAIVQVSPSLRSTPNTEDAGRKGQSRSKGSYNGMPLLERKKSKRNPFSWRRKPGSEKESQTINGEKESQTIHREKDNETISTEQDKLAAILLKEVERRIDPTTPEDYSYNISGYDGENAVDSSIPKEEHVLSTVTENPTELSPHVVIDDSWSNKDSRAERENSTEGMGDSNDLKGDSETFSTEPKRRNLLQCFKPKFRKNMGKGKSDDTKTSASEERKSKVTATTVSSTTESKVPETDERDSDQAAKQTKSASMRSKRPSKAIKNAGKKKPVRKSSTLSATTSPAVPKKTKTPPAVSKHRKKGDFMDKRESPSSVLHFENVSEVGPSEDVKTRTKRRIWIATVDPASGRTYYFHRVTRQTTWIEPEDVYESDEATDIRGDRNDSDSVSCKLDEKFALVDDKEDVDVVKSAMSKQKGAAKLKGEPSSNKSWKNLEASLARAKTDSATQPPVYSKHALQWSVSTEAAQQPYGACASADELKKSITADAEKVTTQLFQQLTIVDTKEPSQLKNKSKSSTVALPNAVTESPYQTEGMDDDELSRPEDEITGTLATVATPKEDSLLDDSLLNDSLLNDSGFNSKEESTKDSTVSNITFSSSLKTRNVEKKLKESLWEDLLFM